MAQPTTYRLLVVVDIYVSQIKNKIKNKTGPPKKFKCMRGKERDGTRFRIILISNYSMM